MTADAATIRATVEAYCAAFTAGDQDAYVALFAPDAWIEDPVGTPRDEGHEAIAGVLRPVAARWPSRSSCARPDRCAWRSGECAFPMQARPVIGGDTYVVDIIDVMTFDDAGKITTMRAFWDPAEMRPADDA